MDDAKEDQEKARLDVDFLSRDGVVSLKNGVYHKRAVPFVPNWNQNHTANN